MRPGRLFPPDRACLLLNSQSVAEIQPHRAQENEGNCCFLYFSHKWYKTGLFWASQMTSTSAHADLCTRRYQHINMEWLSLYTDLRYRLSTASVSLDRPWSLFICPHSSRWNKNNPLALCLSFCVLINLLILVRRQLINGLKVQEALWPYTFFPLPFTKIPLFHASPLQPRVLPLSNSEWSIVKKQQLGSSIMEKPKSCRIL